MSLTGYVTLNYGTSALVLWGIVAAMGLPPSGYSGTTWAAFFLMALVPQILGHSSYNWALRWLSGGTVALCLLGEPIGSTILAAIFLSEPVTWGKAAGGALILAGIFIASQEEQNEPHKRRKEG